MRSTKLIYINKKLVILSHLIYRSKYFHSMGIETAFLYIFLFGVVGHGIFLCMSIITLMTYKETKVEELGQEMGVSVIVASKNELENLKKHLTSLLSQAYGKYEIIVVDDRSTDGSRDFLQNLRDQYPQLKIVRIDSTPDHINHKKYAIIMGMKAAANDLLLLTDADCQPHSERWIATMMAPFSNPSVELVLGYSQYRPLRKFLHHFIGYETILTGLNYITFTLLGKPYMGVGRNIAYRKSLLMENNGFGQFLDVVGGDDDLLVQRHAKRKNTRLQLGKNAMVYSLPKNDLESYWIQKKRHLSVGKLYRPADKLLLALQFITKLCFWAGFLAVILSDSMTQNMLFAFIIVLLLQLAAILMVKWRTDDKTGIWLMPLLEIVFIFYYISNGLTVLFAKNIKWK